MNLHNAEFIKSATDKSAFINDSLPKIVFVGRSNVGKSSVINKILNRKGFARTSSIPGKTACVNYFKIDQAVYFIDLPGYGFAKVSFAEKDKWSKFMSSFFENGDINFGCLIADLRHGLTENDKSMADFFYKYEIPFCIVANKCDKLSKTARELAAAEMRELLMQEDDVKVIVFSAETGEGKDKLLSLIQNMI